MSSKRLLLLVSMAIAAVIFSSCKDDDNDDDAPAAEFVFANTTISLKDANIYRISNNTCCNNHSIRAYVITDGVYSNVPGFGWEADDYTGETYYLIVTLLEPDGAEHGVGEYPMYPWWDLDAYTHERMAYVDLFTTADGNTMEYLTGDDRDTSPVVIKGGMNIGEEMTISFEGQLVYRINQVYQTYEKTHFNFSGKVLDVQ